MLERPETAEWRLRCRAKTQSSIDKITKKLIEEELKGYFKPEFLNRFDGVIVFKPLSMTHVVEIAKLMVDEFKNKLKKLGMKALLGVGQGSIRGSYVAIIEWQGTSNKNKKR